MPGLFAYHIKKANRPGNEVDLSGNRKNAEFLKIQMAIKTELMAVMDWNFAQFLTVRCRLGLHNCFSILGFIQDGVCPGGADEPFLIVLPKIG